MSCGMTKIEERGGCCPACVMAEFLAIQEELLRRLQISIEKHGDWENYTSEEVFETVLGECDEYREAFVAGNVDGPHGQVSELYDVAVTAIKGIRRLAR